MDASDGLRELGNGSKAHLRDRVCYAVVQVKPDSRADILAASLAEHGLRGVQEDIPVDHFQPCGRELFVTPP